MRPLRKLGIDRFEEEVEICLRVMVVEILEYAEFVALRCQRPFGDIVESYCGLANAIIQPFDW